MTAVAARASRYRLLLPQRLGRLAIRPSPQADQPLDRGGVVRAATALAHLGEEVGADDTERAHVAAPVVVQAEDGQLRVGGLSSLAATDSKASAVSSGDVLNGSRSRRSDADAIASILPSLPEWPPRSMYVVAKQRSLSNDG